MLALGALLAVVGAAPAGAQDPVVPVSYSDHMVEELKKHGSAVRYTRHPDRYHEPPTDEELIELLDWFLEHRLVSAH